MPRDWDRHYSEADTLDWTPSPLLVQIVGLLPPGEALDLACGPGRNAIYLAKLGWRVTAVDSSPVAIRLLRERAQSLPIRAVQADLERGEFTIPEDRYDLVCDIHYLQRDLFPSIRAGVKPGGVFVGAVRLSGTFALSPGELRDEFTGWKILFYSEAKSAQIIARRA